MSKNWTDKLPDLMEGYREAAPEGLWDAVLAGVEKPRRKVVPFWWVAGAVAIAAAVVLAVFLWKPAVPEVGGLEQVVLADAVVPADVPEEEATVEEIPGTSPRMTNRGAEVTNRADVTKMLAEVDEEMVEVSEPEDVVEEEPVEEIPGTSPRMTEGETRMTEEETEVVEEEKVEDEPEKVPEPEVIVEPENRPVVKVELERKRWWEGKITLVVRGNYMADAGNIVTKGYGIAYNPGMAGAQTKSQGPAYVAPLMAASRNRESTTIGSHRQYGQFFFGFSYIFTPRWSVETGRNITWLRSNYDSTSGLTSRYTSRDMQYDGIPVYVQYKALEWKGLGLILSAGPMIEACSSADVNTYTYVNSNPSSENKETVDCYDLRFSLHAGAAAQAKISNRSALFVQPGLAWHIPNGGEMESLYTVNPISWELSFGFRRLF